jgi:hypothetical protein
MQASFAAFIFEGANMQGRFLRPRGSAPLLPMSPNRLKRVTQVSRLWRQTVIESP